MSAAFRLISRRTTSLRKNGNDMATTTQRAGNWDYRNSDLVSWCVSRLLELGQRSELPPKFLLPVSRGLIPHLLEDEISGGSSETAAFETWPLLSRSITGALDQPAPSGKTGRMKHLLGKAKNRGKLIRYAAHWHSAHHASRCVGQER